ncbi:MAG: hypothetical protein AAF525_05595 [Pseudomonadota bacterium]
MSSTAFFIFGSGSGTGKTTIASRLQQDLESRAGNVCTLYEIEVQLIKEFAPFQKLFWTGDPAMVDALCEAVDVLGDRYFDADFFISESLFPFLRWLILGNCGPAQIERFCLWMRSRFEPMDVKLIALICDRDTAVGRALQDRGPQWLEQWTVKQRNYPLYQKHPGSDLWEVFDREVGYAQEIGWELLTFDTAVMPREDIVEVVTRSQTLPDRASLPTCTLDDGVYRAKNVSHPLLETIELASGRIKLMGVWLDLIPRSNREARIANSNSVLVVGAYGLTLQSMRFGELTYFPV